MLLACKPGAWFLGRTGNQFNFSFCSGGESWNNALFGGEYPELGEWMHVAAVFERVNESAQGNVEYRLSVYLNGELAIRKMFLYAEPSASKAPVMVGNGNFNGYGLNGCIASFDLYARGLNEGEIDALVKKSERIGKLPSGFHEVNPVLDKALQSVRKQATGNELRWLAEALRRAAVTGYNQNELLNVVKQTALFSSHRSGPELAEDWNKNCGRFKLISSSGGFLLLAAGTASGNSPVLGFYNPKTGNDVLDGRGVGWTLDFDGRQVNDRTIRISNRNTLKQVSIFYVYRLYQPCVSGTENVGLQ